MGKGTNFSDSLIQNLTAKAQRPPSFLCVLGVFAVNVLRCVTAAGTDSRDRDRPPSAACPVLRVLAGLAALSSDELAKVVPVGWAGCCLDAWG
jgi:hypothetical protein